ncbi:MAG: hypothetical protein IKC01_01680 [Clostridia bacterium]|nr:hypothetical protein [Clostridia bacterium]
MIKKSIVLIVALVCLFTAGVAPVANALSENAKYYESVPEIVYATVGKPYIIYYNNVVSLPGIKIVFNIPQELKKNYYTNRIVIAANGAGDYTIPWRVYDSEYVLIDSGEMKFVARESNLKNMTGMVFGDSTVNAGIVTETMLEAFEDSGKKLTLIGTRGTSPNLHEGRGGWSASMYCTLSEQGLYDNPFYNNGFDFSHYMKTQGKKRLDFVAIQLGINDIKKMTLENYSSERVLQYFDCIVESIKKYDSSIMILIGLTIPPSEDVSDFDSSNVFSSEFEYRNNIIHFVSDLMEHYKGTENVYFSAINCCIDTKKELKDLVHPTDAGYAKIGAQYVSTLNALTNKKIVIKAPKITEIKVAKGSVILTWSGTYGATKYQILRNNKVIGEVDELTYRDTGVSSGKTYSYKIKAICSDNKAYMSAAKNSLYIGTPTLVSATTNSKGITVKWNSVGSAKQYFVYRKVKGGSWSRIATTQKTAYTDTKVSSGTRYFYTVIAGINDTKSSYDNAGVAAIYLSKPQLSSVSNKSGGAVIKWKAVKGAKGYYVYRKTSKNGKWTKLGAVKATSYTDKKVASGKGYYYTVKAYNSNGISGYTSGGILTKFLSTPVLSKAKANKTGITVTYGKVAGAESYNIYRKSGKGSWSKIATVKGNSKVSYTDKTAKKGVTYTYTVMAVSGKYISSYNSKGISAKR